jgi:preprotein translocase subunit SecD
MNKRGRLVIVLLVAVMCGFFLYPTVKWYFFVPQETKDLATGSMIQIREYSQGQATIDLRELKGLIASDPSAKIPDKFKFLASVAKDNYKASDNATT